MNKYIGKNCPFCKAPFTEYDDIVICSQCDMPHHKDCWVENGGCTTFGCLGTIKGVDSSKGTDSVTANQTDFEPLFEEPTPTPKQSIIYCTRCGNPNSTEGSFCGKCGSPLRTTTPPPNNGFAYQNTQQQTYTQQSYSQYNQNSQSNYHNPYGFTPRADATADVRMQFVGQNQPYYATKFASMTSQNKKATWNWCAFFFAPYWFIYRRMYEYGAATLAVAFILALIPVWAISLLSFGGYIALGIFANYIYMKKVDTLVAQASHMPEPSRTQFIASKGGVDKKATTWVIIGYFVLSLIINIARM